jgi:hypothetical protein
MLSYDRLSRNPGIFRSFSGLEVPGLIPYMKRLNLNMMNLSESGCPGSPGKKDWRRQAVQAAT